ncbi:MAG: DUF4429 domain-containing protein [Solirubrobacteraceae bacterium]|nr:DUF4429 domain-containing protein [Solirubrobacteraceae bacterium]
MAEVSARDGTWTFDDEVLRIVPGHHRKVHRLRRAIGELEVPVEAIAGSAFEAGRKGGRLRVRLREGADPLSHVAAGKLGDAADPYVLTVDRDAAGAAGYVADEIRHVLDARGGDRGPTDGFVVPGPTVPLTATAGDGTVSFDGRQLHLEWTEWVDAAKREEGAQHLPLGHVRGVEWVPIVGLTNGFLRFRVDDAPVLPPRRDPRCVSWGVDREGGSTVLLAAAVAARIGRPGRAVPSRGAGGGSDARPAAVTGVAAVPVQDGPGDDADGGTAPRDGDPDAMLRRLRELGDLHRDGVLTDDEFAAAKAAVLRHL